MVHPGRPAEHGRTRLQTHLATAPATQRLLHPAVTVAESAKLSLGAAQTGTGP